VEVFWLGRQGFKKQHKQLIYMFFLKTKPSYTVIYISYLQKNIFPQPNTFPNFTLPQAYPRAPPTFSAGTPATYSLLIWTKGLVLSNTTLIIPKETAGLFGAINSIKKALNIDVEQS